MPARVFEFGEFTLDTHARKLLRGGVLVPVSPKAFDLLTCLLRQAGEVVTKEELLKAVWPNSFVEESNLTQHVFALRRALGDCSSYIVTVTGRGYQFTEPVREAPAPSPKLQVVETERPIVVPLASEPGPERPADAGARMLPMPRPFLLEPRVPARKAAMPAGRWVAAALLLLCVTAVVWKRRAPKAPRGGGPGARLLLADLSGLPANASLPGALRQALAIELGQSPFLEVLGQAEAAAVLEQMGRPRNTGLQGETAREVCIRGNGQVLVSSAVTRVGSRLLLTVEATDCLSGKRLGGSKADSASEEGLLKAIDQVAARLREQLGESARSIERFDVPIEQASTPSLKALEAFSLAESMKAHGVENAVYLPILQQAVALDPGFAMGYEEIANTYYALDAPTAAGVAARRAYELSEHVGEREKYIIQAHYYVDTEGDLQKGIETARLWAQAYPRDPLAWQTVNGYLNDAGQYGPAIEAGERALALDRNQASVYAILARSYRRANRFEEARALGEEAIRRGIASPGLRATMYLVALQLHDAALLAREQAWGRAHGGWYGVVTEGEELFAEGKLREGQRLYRAARQLALASHLGETEDVVATEQAKFEYALGRVDEARGTLAGCTSLPHGDPAGFALLSLKLGSEAPARDYLRQLEQAQKPGLVNTLDRYVFGPSVAAALLARHGDPAGAVQLLEPARPYELIDFEVLTLRGALALKAGRPDVAREQYSKILANPGVDNTSPLLTLAHLGLARSHALAGDTGASRAEYEALFRAWKDADRDLPVLLTAREEYARLP